MALERVLESGDIIATGVSEAEYMEKYAGDFCEWEDGVVIKMSPVTLKHFLIVQYLENLLEIYFQLRPIGRVLGEPFVLKVTPDSPRREPDLQIILNANSGQLTETAMFGPADICIEVVSAGSEENDYGKKFVEYQRGGVKEYWIIDSLRDEHHFYRLSDEGIYLLQALDAQDTYQTPLLPGLRLFVPTLWQTPLPDVLTLAQTVREMLAKA
jgi:Uma2 family endonuclease